MSRRRWLILLCGPIAIVVASRLLTQWRQGSSAGPVAGNHVLHAAEPAVALPTTPTPESLAAAAEAAAEKLRARLGDDCAVIVRPPYVLAGDMPERDLTIWHDRTIAPATRAMARSYFQTPPSVPITVLLFTGEQSYNRYAMQLFGEEGISVYGYYKARERTLVMNIGTGGGTLVHEMTHALVDFDFPNVPDWFNEGLASLHEQCRFLPDDAGIEGLTNWRLPALQEAIRQERLGTLESLIQGDDFRGAKVGLNYAQARYFCLYLQEKKLLAEFYRRFRAAQKTDPHGSATAVGMFPDKSWNDVDRDFRNWVLTLRF